MHDGLRIFRTEPVFRKCWAVHEAFGRLGFELRDIYVVLAANVAVQLQAQGKTFTVNVALLDRDPHEFAATWEKVAEAIKEGIVPEAELQECWEAFMDENFDPAGFTLAMKAEGFFFPRNMH